MIIAMRVLGSPTRSVLMQLSSAWGVSRGAPHARLCRRLPVGPAAQLPTHHLHHPLTHLHNLIIHSCVEHARHKPGADALDPAAPQQHTGELAATTGGHAMQARCAVQRAGAAHLWGPGAPPLSTGDSDGSTATTFRLAFCGRAGAGRGEEIVCAYVCVCVPCTCLVLHHDRAGPARGTQGCAVQACGATRSGNPCSVVLPRSNCLRPGTTSIFNTIFCSHLGLEELARARDGAPRAHAAHKEVHLAAGVTPNLGAGGEPGGRRRGQRSGRGVRPSRCAVTG